MKIQEMYLHGFGDFSKRMIGPLNPLVTVIYGPNEAGKSTLLAFIRTVLFGFPFRFRTFYPPIAGGRHGGRITLADDAGASYVVERFSESRGKAGVTTIDGAPLDGNAVLSRLTGQASPDTFKSVFAFSLDDLQREKQEEEDWATSYIYSAGLGAPRLPGLRKWLNDRKSEIFLPRGRSQEVANLMVKLQNVDSRLREVEDNAAKYSTLTTRQDEIQLELEAADTEFERLEACLVELGNLRKGWEDWVALVDCEKKLKAVPQFEQFPEDPISRLEGYQDRVRQAKEDRDEAAHHLSQANQTALAEIADEPLLEDGDNIEKIRRGRSSFDDSVRDLPERMKDLETLESDLVDRLRALGQGWDESRLESFDTSIVVHNEADHWKQTLAANLDAAQKAQFQLGQDKRTLQDLQRDAAGAKENLEELNDPSLDDSALNHRRASLRVARGRLNEYERVRQNRDNLRYQSNAMVEGAAQQGTRNGISRLALPLILGLAGVFLVIVGAFLGQEALLLGIAGGALLLGVAGYLLAQGGPARVAVSTTWVNALGDQVRDVEAAAESALELLVETGLALGLNEAPDAAALDNVEAQLEAATEVLKVWNAAYKQVDETTRRLKPQEQRANDAQEEVDRVSESQAAAQTEWRSWLQSRNLPESFTPDTMIAFLGRIDAANTKLEQVLQMRHRVAAIEEDIAEHLHLVQPLADKHGVSLVSEDNSQIGTVAEALIGRLGNVRNLVQQRDEAKRQAEEYQEQLEQRWLRLQEAKKVLSDLLSGGHTDDPEEFRRNARQHAERRELERQHGENLRRLQLLSGPGKKLDTFVEALSQSDLTGLNENYDRLSQQISDFEAYRGSLREERGGVEIQLNQLTSEEESSAIRVNRNTLLEQLRDHAREWSKLTIAESLLEKTRQKFERERQPSVIQHAQRFFSTVTGQRYDRLYAPIGEQTITVIDRVGGSKQPTELSRGTREQLYLALRFGLIQEVGEHTERLPIVVDEVLVNFDPERARRAAEAFAELAQTNQVLVFTCHPETVELFRDAAPDAQVITI